MLLKTAKRLIVFVIGMTIVLIGMVMLVTPGPACVVVPAGLAVLATEFAWARYLFKKGKAAAVRGFEMVTGEGKPQQSPRSSNEPAEGKDDSSTTDRRIEPPA
jgi:hypothetical protein